MPLNLPLRQAALAFMMMSSVVTAQLVEEHNGDLISGPGFEAKRSLYDYVDGIVARVNAAGPLATGAIDPAGAR